MKEPRCQEDAPFGGSIALTLPVRRRGVSGGCALCWFDCADVAGEGRMVSRGCALCWFDCADVAGEGRMVSRGCAPVLVGGGTAWVGLTKIRLLRAFAWFLVAGSIDDNNNNNNNNHPHGKRQPVCFRFFALSYSRPFCSSAASGSGSLPKLPFSTRLCPRNPFALQRPVLEAFAASATVICSGWSASFLSPGWSTGSCSRGRPASWGPCCVPLWTGRSTPR